MRNRGSIFRFIGVCIICFFVIGYSIYGFLFKENNIKVSEATFGSMEDDFAFSEETTKISNEASSSVRQESSAVPEKSSESVAAAANGTVKGKILSSYISPYNAGLSYNNVYVKNSTDLSVDIKSLLEAELGYKITKSSEPEVLIMHTHTTESFMTEDTDYYTEDYTSRNRDTEKNMVKVGNIVADKLKNAGISVIHDTTEHDYPNYTGSYSRAAETITSYLHKYPSIKIVLDLHRDAVESGDSDKVKLVTEIGGKKAAQVMIVMGSQSGSVTNFPDWQENFKLALKLQQTIEVKYPTLARPVSLMSKSYNECLTTGSLLIEFGTDANTIDEACYSAEMVGDSIAELLNNLN